MKKLMSILLSVWMIVSCMAVGFADEPAYTPGTYTAIGMGRNANLSLDVTFNEHAITDIQVSHVETPTIGGLALEILTEEALVHQTSNLDVISGATISSAGFKMALADTIKQAGGNAGQLEKYSRPAQDYQTEADVIVIGAGGAGLTAALTANENGASVILLEKSGVIGGNFIAAQSGVNAANAKIQQGIEGTDAVAFKEMQMNNDLVREKLVDALVDNSGAMADWLTSKGVEFTVQENNPIRLNATADGTTTITIVDALTRALEESAVQLYTDTRATELIQDENGKITAVKATGRGGVEVTFHANKGVILATGGYGKDHDRVLAYRPDYSDTITAETAPTTGDGLDIALAVGGVLVDMGEINMHTNVLPGYGMLTSIYMPGGRQTTGIWVNKEARRFVKEAFNNGSNVDAILSQTDGDAYMVFDAEGMNDTLGHLLELGIVKSAGSPEELGKKLGIDGEALAATIAVYNEDIADGTDDAFGKAGLEILDGDTFYGYRFKVGVHYFMGGVLIDPQAHVVTESGAIIPGLYAAGEVTGGVQGTTRVDGTGVGDSLTFGYIAGQSVMGDPQ
ncbi:MAG: flavocytochrome c [Clostridia bacterium]|nr:flavocytochrome c [Clostridia bacterium]